MKKILSILLSVMLILGTLSVLMMLPASATTGSEDAVGPVNLIVNGDGVGKPYYSASDAAPNLEDYTDASWQDLGKYFAYNWDASKGTGSVSYYPVGWRTGYTKYANLDYRSLRNEFVNNVDKYTYTSYDDPADPYAMTLNAAQQAFQDFVIEAGKYYTVSADVTIVPTTDTVATDWTFDMFVDTLCWDNEGAVSLNESTIKILDTDGNGKVDLKAEGSGRNPEGTAPTGYDWNLVNTDEERAAINAHLQSGMGKGFTAADGKVYHNSGDFKTYSFTFSADEFIAANSGIKNNGDGTYTVRLVIRNGISQARLAFDNVMVYENAAVEAAAGGVIAVADTTDYDTALAYTPGEEISVTAYPYYGNNFKGWYETGADYTTATPVSTNLTYTGAAQNLTAVFNVYNQIADGSIEYTGGSEFIANLTAVLNKRNMGAAYRPTVTAIDVPAGTDASLRGQKTLDVKNINTHANSQYNISIPVSVEKGKTYVLSYSYYIPTAAASSHHYSVFTEDMLSNTWYATGVTFTNAYAGMYFDDQTAGNGWVHRHYSNEPLNRDSSGAQFFTTGKWYNAYVMFDTTGCSSVADTGTTTLYITLGCDMYNLDGVGTPSEYYFDNLCFAEATITAPASASIIAGDRGTVSAEKTSSAPIAKAFVVTKSGTAPNMASDTAYYPNVSVGNSVATATPNWGAKFTGWTRDGVAYSTEPTITVSDTATYVANFTGNIIVNGDFSKNDTSAITINPNANTPDATATIMTEGEGENANSYVQLKSTVKSNKFELFLFKFELEKNKKYMISYKHRLSSVNGAPVAAITDPASTATPSFRKGMYHVNGTSYNWGTLAFASQKAYMRGTTDYTYDSTPTSFLPASVNAAKGGTGTHLWGTYAKDITDWTELTYLVDTTTVKSTISGVETDVFASSNTVTLAVAFGADGGNVMALDIDDFIVTEYNGTHYEYTHNASNAGRITASRYVAVNDMKATYTAEPAEGYTFDGWYEANAETAISTDLTYVPTNAVAATDYKLTAKFSGGPVVSVNNDFEDGKEVADYPYTYYEDTVTAEIAAHDTQVADYTADLGAYYLKVVNNVDDNGHCDFSIPVKVTAGKKTLVHFKTKVLSFFAEENPEDSNAGHRFDVRVDSVANSWNVAKNVSGKIIVADAAGKNSNRSFDAWHEYQKTDPEGNPLFKEDGVTPDMAAAGGISYGTSGDIGLDANFKDVYVELNSSADQTVYVTFGLRNGGEFAIDNVWAYTESELVAVTGSTLDADVDTNKQFAYATKLTLPAELATNKISTYVAPYTRLKNEAPECLYNFTDELNAIFAEAGQPRIVSKARTTAAEGEVIMNEGVAFTNGKFYAEFFMGETFNPKTKYAVRSEIALSDIYGHDLGITISTNNGEDGLYVRSANQIKRVIAKVLVTDKGVMPFDIEIAPVDGMSKWNGDITQVWTFVKNYKKYLG